MSARVRFCPNCNAKIAMGQKKCTSCGTRLSTPQHTGQQGQQMTQRKANLKQSQTTPKGTASKSTQKKQKDVKKEKVKKTKKGGYWQNMERSEIRKIKYSIFSIEIVVIVLLMINMLYETTIIDLDKTNLPFGFYFPIGYLLLFILLLIFIISAEGLAFKYIEIKKSHTYEKRTKLIKNYRGTAQSVLVTAVVILIIVLSLNFFPIFTDLLSTEGKFEVTPFNLEEDHQFEEQDAFGITSTNSFSLDSNDTVEVQIWTKELDDKDDLDKEFVKEKDLDNQSKTDITLSDSDFIIGHSPNKRFKVFIRSVGNTSTNGKYTINREISKTFIFNIALFMILFIITSVVWLAYLSVSRKKYEEQHIKKAKELVKKYEVKPYTIEDVFLIYSDGTLINHQTRRLQPMNNDILSGMLTAIKDFVKVAFREQSKGDLDELKYGKLKILIETGQFSFLAVVISGEAPKKFRQKMKQVVGQINKQYFQQLKNFNGIAQNLVGVDKIIERQLLSTGGPGSQFDETSEIAWNNKGVVFTRLGKFNEALDCFDQALEINPGASNVWMNRGIALVKLNEFEEAMDCFDRALQLDPNNDSAKRRRNKCWYKWKLLEGREEQITGKRKRHEPRYIGEPAPRIQPAPRMEVMSGGTGVPVGGPTPSGGEYYDDDYDDYDEPPPRCPDCGQPLRFVDEFESWYCDPCDIYPYDD